MLVHSVLELLLELLLFRQVSLGRDLVHNRRQPVAKKLLALHAIAIQILEIFEPGPGPRRWAVAAHADFFDHDHEI